MWCDVDEGEQLVNVFDVEGCIWEVKVSTDIDHFPLGLEPMPYTSVALVAYLNVRLRKLGTISFRLSTSYSMILRTQGHCLRGIYAWPTQITSNKPSPAVVPLQLCNNWGGIRLSAVLVKYMRYPSDAGNLSNMTVSSCLDMTTLSIGAYLW